MIFLQCVGSVCRSRKRASYLQGGSEMIMRKKNNRKTKSSGHWALFSLLYFEYVANIIWEEVGGGQCEAWKKRRRSVAAERHRFTGRAYRSSAPEAAPPPKTCLLLKKKTSSVSRHWKHILIMEHFFFKERHPGGCFVELWPWALVLSHLFCWLRMECVDMLEHASV